MNVKNKLTGVAGLVLYDEKNEVYIVYELPKHTRETARVFARYKTSKGLWQRWEVLDG